MIPSTRVVERLRPVSVTQVVVWKNNHAKELSPQLFFIIDINLNSSLVLVGFVNRVIIFKMSRLCI